MLNCGVMQMDAIKLFCDVAQHRSISRGAALNGVTQSAASQRIMNLEHDLGVRLIDRSTRPLTLTPSGEVYHRGCRQILDRYVELTRQIQDHPPMRGEVHVAAIYSAGIDLLNQVKRDFEQENPQTHVFIDYAQPDVVYQQVVGGQAGLGILSYPRRWRDLAATPLRDERMVVATRPDHPLSVRQAINAAELGGHELATFDRGLPIGRRIAAYLRSHNVDPQVVHTFDNIDTIKTYIGSTDAIAILPGRTVQREADGGRLSAIELHPALIRPLAIVTRGGGDLTPPAKSFMNYLLKTQVGSEAVTAAPEMPAAAAERSA